MNELQTLPENILQAYHLKELMKSGAVAPHLEKEAKQRRFRIKIANASLKEYPFDMIVAARHFEDADRRWLASEIEAEAKRQMIATPLENVYSDKICAVFAESHKFWQ